MRKVKWGVMGAATIARNLVIPAMERAEKAEFYAIASRDPQKTQAYAAKGVKTYASYDALLNDPEVEAIYLPLPNHLHCAWAVKAARHKKHILCEKPLAMNAGEARQMAQSAAENGVYLMEAFMYRFTAKTQKVCEIVRAGALGEIRYMHAVNGFDINDPDNVRLVRQAGGGALLDMGCYCINFFDMVMELCGAKLQKVDGSFVNRTDKNGEPVDVRCNANLLYSNGTMCNGVTWFDGQPTAAATIVGKKGTLTIPHPFTDEPLPMTLHHYDYDADPNCAGREIMVINPDYIKGEAVRFAQSDRYRLELEELSRAILEGTPPSFGIEASLRNMETISTLYTEGTAVAETGPAAGRG